MTDVSQDLLILYRAVSRKQGHAIEYAGCLTAEEALGLTQLGLGRIVDVKSGAESSSGGVDRQPIPGAIEVADVAGGQRSESSALIGALRGQAGPNQILMFLSDTCESSHAAATLAARAGFFCALNILDSRECFWQASHRKRHPDINERTWGRWWLRVVARTTGFGRRAVAAQSSSIDCPGADATARSTSSRFKGDANVSMKS